MISVPRSVVKHFCLAIKDVHHHIHPAVVVQVAESGAPVYGGHLESRPGSGSDILKLSISKIAEPGVRLRILALSK